MDRPVGERSGGDRQRLVERHLRQFGRIAEGQQDRPAQWRPNLSGQEGRERFHLFQFIAKLRTEEIDMSKFCAKGHQMEDSWDTCPTCQTTGYQVHWRSRRRPAAAKTRLESEPAKEARSARRRRRPANCAHLREAKASCRRMVRGNERRSKGRRLPAARREEHGRIRRQTLRSHFDDSTVSGQHASVRYEDGKFIADRPGFFERDISQRQKNRARRIEGQRYDPFRRSDRKIQASLRDPARHEDSPRN